MGLYLGSQVIPKPYLNGIPHNAFINGKNIWELADIPVGDDMLSIQFYSDINGTVKSSGSVTPKWTEPSVAGMIQYSRDKGATWSTTVTNTQITSVGTNPIWFRAISTATHTRIMNSASDNSPWILSTYAKISGNIVALLRSPVPNSMTFADYCFVRLFAAQPVINIDDLRFYIPAPATTTRLNYIFQGTFQNTQIKNVPETLLNLTYLTGGNTIGNRSYSCAAMFSNCKRLETVGRDLIRYFGAGNYCYSQMFYGCDALKNTPWLYDLVNDVPGSGGAASRCFNQMFMNCTSLVDGIMPQIGTTTPGTLIATSYYGTFTGCTSLIKTPLIICSATSDGGGNSQDTSLQNCFSGCTSLAEVTLNMPQWGVATSDGTMPVGFNNWLGQVAANGVFKCPSTLTDVRGNSFIPDNWSKVNL